MNTKPLRRYTNLPALLYMLAEGKITLLDPRSWDDTNDSYYLGLYKEKKGLQCLLALCFTQATETYHHWRVFAPGSSGVCIRFNHARLLNAIEERQGVRAQSVMYLKLTEARGRPLVVDELPFIKRYPFEHEEEYRLIYESTEAVTPTLDIPVSLACIDRITLSPWIPEALADQLKQVLKSVQGCKDLTVVRSTLIGNDQWKRLGDEAC